MRRTYVKPVIRVVKTGMSLPIASSGVYSTDKNIGYGGVDTEGTMTPSSRRMRGWDFEDEE